MMDPPSTPWDHSLAYASQTDIGMRRSNNQDSCAVMLATDRQQWEKRGHMLVVADGMGAHAAGELASKLATDGITHTYSKFTDRDPPQALLDAVREVNRQIHNRGQADREFEGMGTTCSALLLLPQGALIGHVGDSRIYLLRDHTLQQLTFDHSLVWEMKASGQISDSTAGQLPKNVITRSLGPNAEVQVDLEGPRPLQVGDTFLLCSDGLSGPVEDDEIGPILDALPPDEAAQLLVDLANLRGGPDNITAVVLRVLGPPLVEDENAGEMAPSLAQKLLWAVAAVCAAVAGGMYFLGAVVPAVLSGMGAAVAAIVAVLQKVSPPEPDSDVVPMGPWGSGPYSTCRCAPDKSIFEKLTSTGDELCNAAYQSDWKVDWSPYENHHRLAQEAVQRGDWSEAVAQQGRGILDVMRQLRQQQALRSAPSDSAVDLI